MSYRRHISFTDSEKDLVDFYDQNGKAKVAKKALEFYIENKDKLIIGSLSDVLQLVSNTSISKQTPPEPYSYISQNKLQKLIK